MSTFLDRLGTKESAVPPMWGAGHGADILTSSEPNCIGAPDNAEAITRKIPETPYK